MSNDRLAKANMNMAALAETPDPGDGIVHGLNAAGNMVIQAYWMTGEETSARQRSLGQRKRSVKANVDDPEQAYTAMTSVGNLYIVANGSHMDSLVGGLTTFRKPLAVSMRAQECQPEGPAFKPKLAGLVSPYIGLLEQRGRYEQMVQARDEASGRVFFSHNQKLLTETDKGIGEAMYDNPEDDPSPAPFDARFFFSVPLGESVDEIAETFWDHLNPDNRVAIAVRGIHVVTNEVEHRIISAER
jgi:hypothetical protein